MRELKYQKIIPDGEYNRYEKRNCFVLNDMQSESHTHTKMFMQCMKTANNETLLIENLRIFNAK